MRGDHRRDLVRARPQLVGLDDLGHQPDPQCGCGADAFVVAGQGDSQGLAETDAAHQPDRLERAHQPALTCESKKVASAEQITTSDSLTK